MGRLPNLCLDNPVICSVFDKAEERFACLFCDESSSGSIVDILKCVDFRAASLITQSAFVVFFDKAEERFARSFCDESWISFAYNIANR